MQSVRAKGGIALDAIQLIKRDHAAVERLFKQFERAEKREDEAGQGRVVRELVKELSIHASIEELLLYPALRRAEQRAEDDVLEALEEHHLVKLTLDELEDMSPDDERYCAKMNVLIEAVRHHVEEEEGELLPKLKRALDANQLRELGDLLATAKRASPTRPHPSAPDTPPGNLLTGAHAAPPSTGRRCISSGSDPAPGARARHESGDPPVPPCTGGASLSDVPVREPADRPSGCDRGPSRRARARPARGRASLPVPGAGASGRACGCAGASASASRGCARGCACARARGRDLAPCAPPCLS